MMKLKLITYSYKGKWDDLCELISRLKYTEESTRGIMPSDITLNEISATFYEKIVYSELISDPINGHHEVNRETFFITDFFISKNGILCLINPSRRTASFMTFISSNLGYTFFIEDKLIDIDGFCNIAKQKLENFLITKATFKQFLLSESLKCSLALSTTTAGSVPDLLEEIKISLPRTPGKISFSGSLRGQKLRGEVSQTGLISLSLDKYDSFLELLISNQKSLFLDR